MDQINEYIWQRRIQHGVRYQKGEVPFPDSVEIGLEFNGALGRKEKLDTSLLTNGIMLEIGEFAKCVTKSERFFLFEMLEFNFNLHVDVDQSRIHSKTKQMWNQLKSKPERWKEQFLLPDVMDERGAEKSRNDGPNKNQVLGVSVLTAGRQSRPSGSPDSESNGDMLITRKSGGIPIQLNRESFPHCKELGVTLFIRSENTPENKLETNLLTKGIMIELLCFARTICGTCTSIVYDLLKQNFGLDLDRALLRLHMTRLTDRKNNCITFEDRDAFLKEVYVFANRNLESKKRKTDSQDNGNGLKQSKRTSPLRQSETEDTDFLSDADLSYMCPLDFDTELLSEPENVKGLETEGATLAVTVKQEEEEVFVSSVEPQIKNTHLVEIQTKNKAVSGLFSEDKIEDMNAKTPKQRLWMRRATRSKHILSSSKVTDTYSSCRAIGLDFNIGSDRKQKLDLNLFTNSVLGEIYKFATFMRKSFQYCLFEILENNFNLFQDEQYQRNFIAYIVTKERILQTNPARHKMEFLRAPFEFPKCYHKVDVSSDFQSRDKSEEYLDSVASKKTHQEGLDPYPFCRELGIDLWSDIRPRSQKLDLTTLTKGAALEMISHVRDLCGTVHETVNDILEHNFDLDLQGGEKERVKAIERWHTKQRAVMARHPHSKISNWLKLRVSFHEKPPVSQKTFCKPVEDVEVSDATSEREMLSFNGNVRSVKSGHRSCRELGLDLNINVKKGAKKKLDLRVLTRRVLMEIHQHVLKNSNRYIPTLYQILEYNFDLSSQNHRKVEFAWSIGSQVLAIARKISRRGTYLNQVFELPFKFPGTPQVVCKEEPESELDCGEYSDVTFVRQLKPVDMEVEIE